MTDDTDRSSGVVDLATVRQHVAGLKAARAAGRPYVGDPLEALVDVIIELARINSGILANLAAAEAVIKSQTAQIEAQTAAINRNSVSLTALVNAVMMLAQGLTKQVQGGGSSV